MPPAPEFTTQTPGEPIATITPLAPTTETKPQAPTTPAFTAKHNGGGRWKIWATATDDWFSDYLVTGEGAKEQAEAEAERLIAGGDPFVKQAEQQPEPKVKPSKATSTTTDIDATTLKQAVLTDGGWLCPEPVVKG